MIELVAALDGDCPISLADLFASAATEGNHDGWRQDHGHPILAKLTAGGADNAMSLSGYIGTSLQDGHVKLYPTLDDLSESVEIARADILHAADDPKAPQGGTTVWVKKDAPVTYHRTESVKTSAQQLPITFSPGGARAGGARAINDAVDVARGRLRMQVRRVAVADTCQSRCSVCHSRCSVYHSRCSSRQE